jgi:ubiquinone/menaquinone biosynthesis C-methylase UbiE
MMPTLQQVCCPRCHGALVAVERELGCTVCGARYAHAFGIPDLRVEPDPWISPEDDREKGRRLERETHGMPLDAMVRAYWEMTPHTSPEAAARFTEYVVDGEARGDALLTRDAAESASLPPGPWLEIGCGTGDFVVAAAKRGIRVVGLDVAFRWLVVARRRAALAGAHAALVCGNGERLPFANDTFARVVMIGTLEHCRRAADVLREARRVLMPGGALLVRSVNRYTLLSEPHVGVWGVGFVPRRMADAYVRWRSGARYLHHHPLSMRELAALTQRAGFSDVHVRAASLLPIDAKRLGSTSRRIVPFYDTLRSARIIGNVVAAVAPVLEARGCVA